VKRHLDRWLFIALLGSATLLITATAAIGTTRKSVTLNLHGGKTQKLASCHQTHKHVYHAYRVHTSASMDGYVIPAPALPNGSWRVKIKFKQCKRGHFVTVSEVHVKGGKGGHFSYARSLGVSGFFFARAYYYGYTPSAVSKDAYFDVTR